MTISPSSGVGSYMGLGCAVVSTDPDGGDLSFVFEWTNETTGEVLETPRVSN